MCRGMKDQELDFNSHHKNSSLPASWAIQVPGRPPKPAEDQLETEEVVKITFVLSVYFFFIIIYFLNIFVFLASR